LLLHPKMMWNQSARHCSFKIMYQI